MWLSVDRIEANTVILVDDDGHRYTLEVSVYHALTGQAPVETHMLWGETRDGGIISAHISPEETSRRTTAAQAKLYQLVHHQK